jgi:signal transduction histidine kinase
MATYLESAIQALNRLGFWSVVIPFVLAFAVVFALLQKTKILGEKSTRYNAVIAFVFSMLFVYFVDLAHILYFTLYVVILGLAGIMIYLLFFAFGWEQKKEEKFFKKIRWWVILGIMVFLAIVFAGPFVDWDAVMGVLINPATVMLAVFIAAFWFILGFKGKGKEEEEKEEKKEERKAEEKAPEQKPGQRKPPLGVPGKEEMEYLPEERKRWRPS